MQDFLRKNLSVSIGDIARSLQKINHALEHRVAILASSIHELLDKLNLLQETKKTLVGSGIYISLDQKVNVNSHNSSIIRQALDKENIRQLAQYWVEGATIDFRQLPQKAEHPWISLPKYAFDHNIQFDFNQSDSALVNGISSDQFCKHLFEKISKDEISEDQFKALIMM